MDEDIIYLVGLDQKKTIQSDKIIEFEGRYTYIEPLFCHNNIHMTVITSGIMRVISYTITSKR